MDTSLSILLIILLLAANGFFVAAEFALVKARGARIQSLALQGSASARLAVKIQANLEAYLAACQLGITMASLGLGWVGEPAVAALLEPLFLLLGLPPEALHTAAFITGFLLFSSLHIVIGEQLPKTVAIRRAEPVSLWVAYPLQACYLAVWPLNWLLNRSTTYLLGRFGIEESSHADVYTSEEIRGLLQHSSEHGEILQEKAEMLSNLFEFYQRQVSAVMIPCQALVCLDLGADPELNRARIRDSGHSRFPVIDSRKGDEIAGLLLAKDIQRALLSGVASPWRQLEDYTREPLVVPESQQVPRLFELMRTRREHMAMVVDEYGKFVGIVTLEDLLEEIVGEIHDETDQQMDAPLRRLGAAQWEVDGLISLTDLRRETGVSLEGSGAVNTVSGLFMERLGRLAQTGDQILLDGHEFTVTEMADRRVGRAQVTRKQREYEEVPRLSPSDG